MPWLLFVFSIIIIIEVPELVKNRMWRELLVFSVLLLTGMLYSIGQIYEWPLPNPTGKMEYMFEPVSAVLEKLLSF